MALPRAYAERRPVASGQTPHDVLLGQLDLMDQKMREAADAILAHDSEKLLANGRFLADRFSTSSLQIGASETAQGISAPPPAPTPAATQVVTPAPEALAEREQVR